MQCSEIEIVFPEQMKNCMNFINWYDGLKHSIKLYVYETYIISPFVLNKYYQGARISYQKIIKSCNATRMKPLFSTDEKLHEF